MANNNIVKAADFKGIVQLKDATEQSNYFDQIVFEIERDILRGTGNFTDGFGYGFLGDAEYILLADDMTNGVPQSAPWVKLVAGVNYVDASGRTVMFRGLKEMLKLMVYSEFLKRDSQSSDGSGIIVLKAENAEVVEQKRMRHEAHIRWNIGVDMFNGEAYDYMIFNKASFSNWLYTRQSKFIMNGIN